MSSLRNERPRCVSTVFSVTNSVWAICRLVPPLAASSTTRRSLGVSEVSPGAVGAARPRADRGELAPLGAPGPRSRNGRPALTPRTEAPGPRCVVRRRARLHRGQWVRVRASSSPDSATAGMYESIVGDASGHAMFGGRCQGVCLMCDASRAEDGCSSTPTTRTTRLIRRWSYTNDPAAESHPRAGEGR